MKLTADQKKTRDKAFETFEDARERLQSKIDDTNSVLADLRTRLEEAENAYNEAAEACADSIHEIGAELTEAINEKSDKWQESDAGTQACSLAEAFENFEIDGFNFDEFIEIEAPEADLEQLLADLPDDSSEL